MTFRGSLPWALAAVGAAVSVLAGAGPSGAQPGTAAAYPRRLDIDRYLMDRNDEIALARSAAPDAISKQATVLVLGRGGYETAIQGTNGFVCMVERGWVGALDWPEFYSPRIRGADCLNPAAARSVLPLALLRTALVLADRPKDEIVDRIRVGMASGKLPPLEPGAMSYMMGRGSYLSDHLAGHNGPHLMFYQGAAEATPWGADLPGSPIHSGPYWFGFGPPAAGADGLPPMRVFTIGVETWSDGSPAAGHMH
jgi:hypothetical protein